MGRKGLQNALDVSKQPRSKPIQFLDGDTIKRLCGKDMKYAKYPILMDFSDPRFVLRSLKGIEGVSPVAIKEINLTDNKLTSISELSLFSNIMSICARNNMLNRIDFEIPLKNLETLDLANNQLSEVPDLSRFPNLKNLNLSSNVIAGPATFVPFKVKHKRLKRLYMAGNGIKMTPYEFVAAIKTLSKDNLPKLAELDLRVNPVARLPHYRAWVVTNVTPNLQILDGEDIIKSERKEKPPMPEPDVIQEETTAVARVEKKETVVAAEPAREEVAQSSKKRESKKKKAAVTTYVFNDLKGLLVKCFERPVDAMSILGKLEGYITEMVAKPPSQRFIEYSDAAPEDSIDEFLQSLSLLLQRLPQVANTCVRSTVRLIAILDDPIGPAAKEHVRKLMDMQGLYDEAIWLAVRDVIVPELQEDTISKELKEHFLEVLYIISCSDSIKDVHSSLLPLVPSLAKALQDPEPEYYLLGIIAAAATDTLTAEALYEHGVCQRTVELVNTERKTPMSERFKFLIRTVSACANNSRDACKFFVENKVHLRTLVLVNEMNFEPSSMWPEDESDWAAMIIQCQDSLNSHDTSFMAAMQSDYARRLLEILEFPDVRARLLAVAIVAIRHLLERTTDTVLLEEIAKGIGYAVPLLDYIEGVSYDAMARQVGAVKRGEPVPLTSLKSRKIINVLMEIVRLVEYYAIRASERSDASAVAVSQALDTAERERYLFALLNVPNDDLRLAAVNCLSHVPLSNLQADEVDEIVRLLDVKNIGAGRTEEVLAVVLKILETVAADQGEQGSDFHKRHGKSVRYIMKLLEKNSARDVGDSDKEQDQKLTLSEACANFLIAASTGWAEAEETMRSQESVNMAAAILQCDEVYGSSDRPVWVEKAACGSTIKANFQFLEGLQATGHVAPRIITRMAEVIEGKYCSPPEEDEENQDAKMWKRHLATEETEEERQARYKQCEDFVRLDGITKIISYLHGAGIDSSGNVDDLDPTAFPPHDIVSGALAEAQLLEEKYEETLKKGGALGEDMDEEDVGGELDHEHEKRMIVETNIKKRRMVEAAVQGNVDMEFEEEMEFFAPRPIGRLRPTTCVLELSSDPIVPTLAATLRLILALLWNGDRETREAIRNRLCEASTLKTLAVLARTGDWYTFNVGARFLMVADDLLEMPISVTRQPMTIVPVVDLISQVMESMLCSIDGRLNQGLTLTPREELCMAWICRVFYRILLQVSYIDFSTVDRKINTECTKALFHGLMPPIVLNMIIRFLYYDRLVTTSKLFPAELDSPHQLQLRDIARHNSTLCIAEYIQVHTENRYEILEHFNRLEVSEKLSLCPAFQQELLCTADQLRYSDALEVYMADNYMMPTPERIVEQAWLDMILPGEMGVVRRLLVISNQAYYILKEPFGMKCTACPPDKFCPRGPTLKSRRPLSEICRLTIGFGGYTLVIQREEALGPFGKKKEHVICTTMELGLIDRFVNALRRILPSTAVIEEDTLTQTAIQRQLVTPEAEIILCCVPIVKINVRHTKQNRVMVLTNAGIYNFKESLGGWIGNDTKEKEVVKMMSLKSKYDLGDLVKVIVSDKTDLSMNLNFRNSALNFYNLVFGTYMARVLFRRTLAAHVDPTVFGEGLPAKGGKGSKK